MGYDADRETGRPTKETEKDGSRMKLYGYCSYVLSF